MDRFGKQIGVCIAITTLSIGCGMVSINGRVVESGASRPENAVVFEDFEAVEDGQVPPGWVASSAVRVTTDPSFAGQKALVSSDKGVMLSAPLTLPSDFRVEVRATTGDCFGGFKLNVGSVSFGRWGCGGALRFNDQDVGGSIGHGYGTYVLEKRGDVFTLAVGDSRIHLARIGDFQPASRLRVSLQGDPAHSSIHDLSIEALSSAKPAPAKPTYTETFAQVEEGRVVPGWKADDVVLVQRMGHANVLTLSSDAEGSITVPLQKPSSAFRLEVIATVRGHFDSLTVSFGSTTIEGHRGVYNINGQGAYSMEGILDQLVIDRHDGLLQFFVNGSRVAMQRVPDQEPSDKVLLRLGGGQKAVLVHQLSFLALPGAPPTQAANTVAADTTSETGGEIVDEDDTF